MLEVNILKKATFSETVWSKQKNTKTDFIDSCFYCLRKYIEINMGSELSMVKNLWLNFSENHNEIQNFNKFKHI